MINKTPSAFSGGVFYGAHFRVGNDKKAPRSTGGHLIIKEITIISLVFYIVQDGQFSRFSPG